MGAKFSAVFVRFYKPEEGISCEGQLFVDRGVCGRVDLGSKNEIQLTKDKLCLLLLWLWLWLWYVFLYDFSTTVKKRNDESVGCPGKVSCHFFNLEKFPVHRMTYSGSTIIEGSMTAVIEKDQ